MIKFVRNTTWVRWCHYNIVLGVLSFSLKTPTYNAHLLFYLHDILFVINITEILLTWCWTTINQSINWSINFIDAFLLISTHIQKF
jgi:NADH:ubiquinone oxidoreductase subunit 3 (subunit A)